MTTKQEADQYLKNHIQETYGITLKPSEVSDFCFEGGENETEIEEYARDWYSEIQSERAENAAWKKNQGYWDEGSSLDMNLQY